MKMNRHLNLKKNLKIINSKQFVNKFQQKHSKYVYLLKSMYNIQLLYTCTYNKKYMHLFFIPRANNMRSLFEQSKITLCPKQFTCKELYKKSQIISPM